MEGALRLPLHPRRLWVWRMSLNRYEKLLHDYIESQPEESRYWKAQVAEAAEQTRRREEAALRLNASLWDYFEERSRCEAPFSKLARAGGGGKVSMLNLSEYLLRMWAPPTAVKKRD